ncbi:hypothetical protein LINPERHAP1_LOCUS37776 [Linum perenne]
MIEDRVYHIVYESLENMCFTCGFYGHKDDGCPTVSKASEQPQKTETILEQEAKNEGDIGSWMTVSRRHKNHQIQPKDNSAKHTASGSRFEILNRGSVHPSTQKEASSNKEKTTPEELVPLPENITRQAEALKKMLDAALANDTSVPSMDKNRSKSQRKEPLKDITNTNSTSKNKKGDGGKQASKKSSEVELVSVPVTYFNHTFQAETPEISTAKFPNPSRSKASVAKTRESAMRCP